MKVEKSHHIDCSEKDENGLYDYYYEYDIYRFIENDIAFIVRRYTDEENNAHFLRKEIQGKRQHLKPEDLNNSLFKEAVNHLKSENISKIEWLDDEYKEI